jgi:glycosyltransferase involved in cell wall biosynthesis
VPEAEGPADGARVGVTRWRIAVTMAVEGTIRASKESVRCRPLRLLHVFPGFGTGGVEIRIATIINHHGGRYRHSVIALDGDYTTRARLASGLDVVFPVSGPWPKGSVASGVLRSGLWLLRHRPDVLLTYNWGSIEWAMAHRLLPICRHIHFESGFSIEEADGPLPNRVRARRFGLAGAERVVVPSRTLEAMATRDWGLPAAKVSYVPNGVDLERFAAPPDPSAIAGFAKREGELLVGTITALRAEKNLGRLLRAFAAATEGVPVRLVVVGDGPERAGLEDAARSLGIADRVVFAGFVPAPEKVAGLLDVYALSSDTEQMPNALIQAMAAGLPVAAVDVGDVRLNLSPANRPLVAPRGDEAGLAAALARLLGDASLRRTVGASNRAHVREHYGQERMFRAYRAVFDGAAATES